MAPMAAATQLPLTPGERKAIAAAETFVRTNCYTTLPCDAPGAQLEFPESRGTDDLLLATRWATLNPRAYGISPGYDEERQEGWTVYFERSDYSLARLAKLQRLPPPRASESGLRGLEMNTGLTEMDFLHLDLRRDVPKKLAYPPSSLR